MELEKQVVSLELAQKLKESGAPQESLFYWWTDDETDRKSVYIDEDRLNILQKPEIIYNGYKENPLCFSAFTVAELGEMLPFDARMVRRSPNPSDGWNCDYTSGRHWQLVQASTEADARAKMLIYLLENKLITL